MKKKDVAIGKPVTYWRYITEAGERLEPTETKITSDAETISGSLVCRVEGVSGYVLLEQLDEIKNDNDVTKES